MRFHHAAAPAPSSPAALPRKSAGPAGPVAQMRSTDGARFAVALRQADQPPRPVAQPAPVTAPAVREGPQTSREAPPTPARAAKHGAASATDTAAPASRLTQPDTQQAGTPAPAAATVPRAASTSHAAMDDEDAQPTSAIGAAPPPVRPDTPAGSSPAGSDTTLPDAGIGQPQEPAGPGRQNAPAAQIQLPQTNPAVQATQTAQALLPASPPPPVAIADANIHPVAAAGTSPRPALAPAAIVSPAKPRPIGTAPAEPPRNSMPPAQTAHTPAGQTAAEPTAQDVTDDPAPPPTDEGPAPATAARHAATALPTKQVDGARTDPVVQPDAATPPTASMSPADAPVIQAPTSEPGAQPSPLSGQVTPASPAAPPAAGAPAAQVAQGLSAIHLSGAGARQVTIHLTPGSLGAVQVRIERGAAGAATTIALQAEKPETLRALQQDSAHLHEALDRAGLPSEGRQVSYELAQNQPATAPGGTAGFATGDGGGQGGSGSQRGQPGQPQSTNEPRADADTTGRSIPIPAPARATAPSGINITA